MTVFLILGAIGLVLIVLSLMFGDLFELDGGFVSLPAIAVALVVFGASGAITIALGLGVIWAYLIAIAIGLLAYGLAAGMIRSLQRSGDGLPREVTGSTGTAMSRITTSSGEVSLDVVGEVERRLAFADAQIEQGTRIRVIEQHGTRVKVEPLGEAAADPA